MARLNPRLSAGVGVVAAFLLLGGPATTAIAEPGGWHSDRGNSSDRGNDNGNGNGNGNDRGDGDRHGNGHGHGRSDGHGNGDGRGGGNDRGYDRGGWNRDDDDRGGWNGDDDDRAVSSDVSRRGADNGNAVAAGGGGGGGSPTARVGSGREDVAQLAPTTASRGSGSTSGSDPTAGSRLTAGAGSIGGSGSTSGAGPESPGAPSAGSSSPRVTVGNGRSPGIQSGDPAPSWQAPAFQPAPTPAPPPPPPLPAAAPPSPSWVERFSAPPFFTQQLGVASAFEWSDVLWGIAGLLLIPAAGAALGYRQARASHTAEQLRVS